MSHNLFNPDPEQSAEASPLMQEPFCQATTEGSHQQDIETIVAANQADATSQAYTFLP
jgi:hypothetical protein